MAPVTQTGVHTHRLEVLSVSKLLFRTLMIAAVTILLAGVVSAATYDEDTVEVEQASRTDGDVETDDASTTTVDSSVPATADDSDGESESTTTTDSEPADVTTTTAPSSTAPPSTSATTVPSDDGFRPTTPGRYTYDVTGTVDGERVDGTSTLTVSEVGSDGRQTHVQTAPDGETTTVYRYTSEGRFLESLKLSSDQGEFELKAVSPFLIIPADARSGTETKGTLRGDGLTAKVTFTIVELGSKTSTARLVADISGKVQGFDVDGKMTSDILARTADQLPVETESTSDITAGGGLVQSTSDTRSVLRQ